MNESRPQSSALVDLRDPIQVHLLTETALSDSRAFEILAPEEVDDLKKQMQSLSMRIDQARANLAIQSKYRDAAISMARLYSPPSSKADGKRRSLLGNNRLSDSAKEAEMERLASERRCEELASDLFSLEKRLMEPQRRLLQHTAGVLQMTHRASQKKSGQPPVGPMMMNGIPGSPESLYTYTNTRNSMEIPSDDLYLPLDQVDGPARPRKNTIEIPMKSPIREQNAQLRELREEVDKMKEENERILEENMQLKNQTSRSREEIERLTSEHARATEENSRFRGETSRMADADARMRAIEDQMMAETNVLREQGAGHLKAISETEAKLEVLNRKLRDLIVAFNPAKNGAFGTPGAAGGSGETLTRQLEYMEAGLATATEASADAAGMASSLDVASMRVQALAQQVQAALQQSGAGLEPPPQGTLDEQLKYLEDAFQTVGSELSRAVEASSSASAGKRDTEQVDAVLMGLWEIIQAGYAEIEQQNRALGQGGDDDDDLSSNEFEGFASETYSLQAFSTKVQWLYAQATGLREQKSILQRQIKQQRELNNRSESEKDTELAAKGAELERTQGMLDDAQAQLQQVLADMDTLQKTTAANEAASSSSTRATQDALKDRSARITALETEVRDAQTRLAAADASMADAQSQLTESNTARAAAESELSSLQTQLATATAAATAATAQATQLQTDLKSKDDELEQMNTMVVELKTEVAFAKAELDGAYGSRKQRAAEAAALSSTAQSEELNGQIGRLRTELENALKDLEEITRESIAAERERLDIEGRLDEVLGVKKELEGEVGVLRERLGRVQEELDRERLRVAQAPAAGGAGTRVGAGASMLSEQFRGVMKEERRKFQEEMKVRSFFLCCFVCPSLFSGSFLPLSLSSFSTPRSLPFYRSFLLTLKDNDADISPPTNRKSKRNAASWKRNFARSRGRRAGPVGCSSRLHSRARRRRRGC